MSDKTTSKTTSKFSKLDEFSGPNNLGNHEIHVEYITKNDKEKIKEKIECTCCPSKISNTVNTLENLHQKR